MIILNICTRIDADFKYSVLKHNIIRLAMLRLKPRSSAVSAPNNTLYQRQQLVSRCAVRILKFMRKVRAAHPTFNLLLPAAGEALSNQARTQGENGRLSAIVSAQLVENIADVSLDCTHSNVQLFGDGSIAVTLHDQFQNF